MLSYHQRRDQGCSIEISSPRENSRSAPRTWTGVRGVALCLTAACTLSLLAGCGGGSEAKPMGTITGKITVGGKPLIEGRVNFVSDKGVGAGGNVTPDGSYSLEGPLPVGVYTAFITFDIPPSRLGTDAEKVMKTVPEKYLGQATSGLTAEVKEGTSEYNFDLK